MATRSGRLIEDLYAVLEANFSNRTIRVRWLAHAVGVSERQLQRRLYEALGKTPADVLREYRLGRARELLLKGLPVGDVAYAVGFRSHAYFTHCFREHFGVTPTALKAGCKTSTGQLSRERRDLTEE